jgi:hypothetical protein
MVPDIVKSSTTKMDQMDDAILEREIVSGGILCEKS